MTLLDRADYKILACLQDNGRLTTQELAAKVSLSASQCSRRRARLEEQGYIRGYHADIDFEKLGYGFVALISVTVNNHNRENSERFAHLISQEAAILEAYELTGSMDYVLKVMVPGPTGLTSLINDTLLPHDSVQHINSAVVLETLKSRTGILSRANPLHTD